MIHRKFRLLVALFAAFALVLGACGDDDDSNASTDEGSSQEDTGADDGGDDAEDVVDDAEDEAEDAAEDAIGDLSGDCAFLGEFATTGFDGAFDDVDPFTDGGAGFKTLAEEFGEVADAAPGELKEDFELLADALSQMADALADVDFSDPESFDPSVFESFDQPKFEEAGERIETWLEDHCPGLVNG